MEAKHGPWYFKQNKDGIYIKLNKERVKNSMESLMEQVLEVKGELKQRAGKRSPCSKSFPFKS